MISNVIKEKQFALQLVIKILIFIKTLQGRLKILKMLDQNDDQFGEQFESAQHDVQYLRMNNQGINALSFNDANKKSNISNMKQNVHLKFQKINHYANNNLRNGYNKKMFKNISFQSDKSNDHYFNQTDFDNQDGKSSLRYYYENHQHAELVYLKSRNLGNNCIRNKQYYTSLFATPESILKYNKRNLFGKLYYSDKQLSQNGKQFIDQTESKLKQEQLSTMIQNNKISIYPQTSHDKRKLSTAPQNLIQFDSDFQSGNLFAAYKIGVLQYDLLMQNDINTKGNTQWFYFRIKGLPPNKNLKLNIVNFRKSDSLFNYGMLPCFYSTQAQKQKGQGWIRKGTKVKYFRNNHVVQNARRYYYTLTFTISTEFNNDTIKIAQCYPYTLSDLNNYLNQITQITKNSDKSTNATKISTNSSIVNKNHPVSSQITNDKKIHKQVCHRVTIMSKTLGNNKIQGLIIKQNGNLNGASSNVASLSQTKTFYKNNSNLTSNFKPSSVISTVTSISQLNDNPVTMIKNNANNPVNLAQANNEIIMPIKSNNVSNWQNNGILNPNKNNQRPLIIVMARQHPGQTPGSFILEGFVNYLLTKEKDSDFLRKNYQIRVIPLVNPDGAQVGNYRTNLHGVDLNRRWDCITKIDKISKNGTNSGSQSSQNNNNLAQNTKKSFFTTASTNLSKNKQSNSKNQEQNVNMASQSPQIVYIKRYLSTISKDRQIAYILDFHGHSRKLYSFFYGNSYPQNPSDVKIFPYICSKLSSMIRYQDCTFNLQQQKRATARIQFLMNYKVSNIYTFQASFFGYVTKNNQKKHFTQDNYRHLGMVICKAIYLCQRSSTKYNTPQIQCKQKILYDKWMNELLSNKNLIKGGQQQDSGSESCPQQCQIRQLQKILLEQDQDIRLREQKQKKFVKSINNSQLKNPKNFMRQLEGSPQKSLRQMQVLQIAQVNSVFPNDVLALVPNTFYITSAKGSAGGLINTQYQNKKTKSIEIQTQACEIIKIYGACKIQQFFKDQRTSQLNQDNHSKNVDTDKTNIIKKSSFSKKKKSFFEQKFQRNQSQLSENYNDKELNKDQYNQQDKKYFSTLLQQDKTNDNNPASQISSSFFSKQQFQKTKSKSINDVLMNSISNDETKQQSTNNNNVHRLNDNIPKQQIKIRRGSVDQIIAKKIIKDQNVMTQKRQSITSTHQRGTNFMKNNKSQIVNYKTIKQKGLSNEQALFMATLKHFASSSIQKTSSFANKSQIKSQSLYPNKVNMKRSIHQKQLYQNARHMTALKKSTDIRRHFKKILNDHQFMLSAKKQPPSFPIAGQNPISSSNMTKNQFMPSQYRKKSISNSLDVKRPSYTTATLHGTTSNAKKRQRKIIQKYSQTQISFNGDSIIVVNIDHYGNDLNQKHNKKSINNLEKKVEQKNRNKKKDNSGNKNQINLINKINDKKMLQQLNMVQSITLEQIQQGNRQNKDQLYDKTKQTYIQNSPFEMKINIKEPYKNIKYQDNLQNNRSLACQKQKVPDQRFWTVEVKRKQLECNLPNNSNQYQTTFYPEGTSKSRNQFRKTTLIANSNIQIIRNKSHTQYEKCQKIVANQKIMENWRIKKKSLI